MAGITREQWRDTNRKSRRVAQAVDMSNVSQLVKDVSATAGGIDQALQQSTLNLDGVRKLTAKQNEIKSQLQKAQAMREEYSGNKNAVKAIDTTIEYLNNAKNYLENNSKGGSLLSNDLIEASMPSPVSVLDKKTPVRGEGYLKNIDIANYKLAMDQAANDSLFNDDMMKKYGNMSFEELRKSKNDAKSDREKQWVENRQIDVLTDADEERYKEISKKKEKALKKQEKIREEEGGGLPEEWGLPENVKRKKELDKEISEYDNYLEDYYSAVAKKLVNSESAAYEENGPDYEYAPGMPVSRLRTDYRKAVKKSTGFDTGWEDTDNKNAINEIKRVYGVNDEIAEKIVYDVIKDETMKMEQEASGTSDGKVENAKEGLEASLWSVPINLIGSVPETLNAAYQGYRNIFREYDQPVNRANMFMGGTGAQNMRSSVTNSIDSDVGKFFYQTGMSIADMAAASMAGGSIFEGLGATSGKLMSKGTEAFVLGQFSASAFDNTFGEMRERGASDDEALMLAGISGIAEAFFEKVSLDRLVSTKSIGSLAGVIKETLIQSGIEGSEEIFTDAANALAEQTILQDRSQYSKMYNELIESGMSKREALKQTGHTFAKQLALSFAGGAVAGGAMGGAVSGVSFATDSQARTQEKIGKNIIKNNNLSEIEKFVKENYAEDSETAKQLKELNKKSNMEVGSFVANLAVEELHRADTASEANLTYATMERLQTMGVDGPTASVLAQNIVLNNKTGEQVAETEENKEIEGISAQYKDIVSQVRTEIDNNAKWVQQINTNEADRHNANASFLMKLSEKGNTTTRQQFDEEIKQKNISESEYQEHPQVNDIRIENGVSLPTAEGQSVSFAGIKKNGTVEFNTPEGIKTAEDVVIDTETNEGRLLTTGLNGYGMGANGINQMISSFDGQMGTESYANAFNQFYALGKTGTMTFNRLMDISEGSKELAGRIGYETAALAMKAGEMDAQAEIKQNEPTKVSERKKGKGKYKNKDKVEFQIKGMDKLLNQFAKKTGLDVQVKKEIRDRNGKVILGANGNIDISKSLVTLSGTAQDELGVVFHEMFGEFMEEYAPEEYKDVESAIVEWWVQSQGFNSLNALVQNYQERYRNVEGTKSYREALQEVTNDAFGGVFGTEEGINNLLNWLVEEKGEKRTRSIGQKIADFFKAIAESIKSYLRTADLQTATRTALQMDAKTADQISKMILKGMDAAIRNYQNAEMKGEGKGSDVRNSLYENYKQEIDDWYNNTTAEERKKQGGHFRVGRTSEALKSINVPDKNIYFGRSKIQKILEKHPEMNIDIIKQVPELLENPIIVMDSVTVEGSLLVLGEVYAADGRPVLASMLIDQNDYTIDIDGYNVITSSYAKDNAIKKYQRIIDTTVVRYIEPDKKRTNTWFSSLGLQLPSGVTTYGSINKLPQSKVNSNAITKKFSLAEPVVKEAEDGSVGRMVKLNGIPKISDKQWEKLFYLIDTNVLGVTYYKNPDGLKQYVKDELDIHRSITLGLEDDSESGMKEALDIINNNEKADGFNSLANEQDHIDRAVEEFGTLNGQYKNWGRAGYITSDGQVLDFGMPETNYSQRTADHRDIDVVYEEENFDSGTDALIQFMSEGNIRVIPESAGVDIFSGTEPTTEQFNLIRDYIEQYAEDYGEFNLDFSDENGDYVDSKSYENNINADEIINDIKRFYRTGSIGGSQYNQFRYSLKGWNKYGQEVYETSLDVAKMTYSQRASLYETMLVNYYMGKEVELVERNGSIKKARIGSNTRKKNYTTTKKNNSSRTNRILSKVIPEGDLINVLNGAIFDRYGIDKTPNKNNAHRGLNQWKYYQKQVVIDGVEYNVVIDVRNEKSGHMEIYRIKFNPQKNGKSDPEIVTTTVTAGDPKRAKSLSNEYIKAKKIRSVNIKHSLSDFSQENKALLKELSQYTDYEDLMAAVEDQFTETRRKRISSDDIGVLAKKLKTDTNSKYNIRLLRQELSHILNGTAKNSADISETTTALKALVKDVLSETKDESPMKQFIKEVKGELRKTKINLTDEQKAEVEYRTGESFEKFRRANLGRFIISAEGAPIDSVYGELSKKYPDVFSEDVISDKDMLFEIVDSIEALEEGNDTGFNTDEAAEFYTLELLNEYNNIPEIRSFADKQNDKLQAVREEGNKRLEAMKAEMDRQVERYRAKALRQEAEYRFQYSKARERFRRYTDEELREQKSRFEAQKQRAKERRETTATRNRIKKNVQKINNQLIKPNTKKYIPDGYKKALITFLRSIDTGQKFTKARYEKIIKNIEAEQAKTSDPEKIAELNRKLATYERYQESFKKGLEQLNAAYGKMMEESADGIVDFSDVLKERMSDLVNDIGGTSIMDLNKEQLKDLDTVISMIQKEIAEYNHTVDWSYIDKYGNVAKISDMIRQGSREVKNSRIVDSLMNKKYLAKWMNWILAPERLFNRIGGYQKDNVMHALGKMISEAQIDELRYKQKASAIMDAVMKGKENQKAIKEYQKYDTKHLIDVGLKDADGNAVKIPKGMMIALYMHLTHEENTRHIQMGGLTIPDFKEYYKGNMSDAYGRGQEVVSGIAGELSALNKLLGEAEENEEYDTIEELNAEKEEVYQLAEDKLAYIRKNIEKHLTDYDRNFISCLREYFDNFSKSELNKVTQKRFGVDLASVEGYFPIHTDTAYLGEVFTGKTGEEVNLENAGFMKTRVKAGTPIFMEDVIKVYNDQMNKTAKYVAYLIPQHNLNKILKTSLDGFDTNLTKAIQQNYTGGMDYIDDFKKDLFGGRHQSNSRIWAFLRGGAARSTLTLSISVSIKQAASYPTAAAVLGWKPVAKALAKGGKNGHPLSRADVELINKYTPLYWYRTLGNGSQEIVDMKASPDPATKVFNAIDEKTKGYLFSWIQNIDLATVGRLWSASEYYVNDNFKSLKKGSDEYYRKVAEIYNEVIFKTQPNYTTAQRSAIQRNPNEFTRSMFMFMTQPLQNAGIMVDAISEFKTYQQDFKNKRNNVTFEELQEKKTNLRRAITSQLVSSAVFAAMTHLAYFLMHKPTGLEDDEGEITAKSVGTALFGDITSNLLAGFVGVSELWDLIYTTLSGKTYYAPTAFGSEIISDILTNTQKMGTLAIAIANGEDKSEQLEKTFEQIVTDSVNAVGLPLKNEEKIRNAVIGWYNDAKDGNGIYSNVDYDISTKKIVQKYVRSGDISIVNDLLDTEKADIKAKYPAYSSERIDKEAKAKVRGKLTTAMKDAYLSAGQHGKKDILSKMKKTGVYTKTRVKDKKKIVYEASKEIAAGWEKEELKKEYLATSSKDEQKKLRDKLWKTGYWKKREEMNKAIKQWTE